MVTKRDDGRLAIAPCGRLESGAPQVLRVPAQERRIARHEAGRAVRPRGAWQVHVTDGREELWAVYVPVLGTRRGPAAPGVALERVEEDLSGRAGRKGRRIGLRGTTGEGEDEHAAHEGSTRGHAGRSAPRAPLLPRKAPPAKRDGNVPLAPYACAVRDGRTRRPTLVPPVYPLVPWRPTPRASSRSSPKIA